MLRGGRTDVFDINEKAVSIGNYKPSDIYTRYTSRMYETNRRFDKTSYNAGYVDATFRGRKLMAIRNAATFLEEMYGDFYEMPSDDKRVPEHAVNMLKAPKDCIKWFN